MKMFALHIQQLQKKLIEKPKPKPNLSKNAWEDLIKQHLQHSGAMILYLFWEILTLLNSFEAGTLLDRLHALFESEFQVSVDLC